MTSRLDPSLSDEDADNDEWNQLPEIDAHELDEVDDEKWFRLPHAPVDGLEEMTLPDYSHIRHTPFVIGNAATAASSRTLSQLAITHILTVLPIEIAPQLEPELKRQQIGHVRISIEDSRAERLYPHLKTTLPWMKQSVNVVVDGNSGSSSRPRMLVHCFQGMSRSVSFVVAYLIVENGLSYDSALEQIRSDRPIARPNPSFELQLRLLDALPIFRGDLSLLDLLVDQLSVSFIDGPHPHWVIS